MTNAMPTLPADFNITLGVAKILLIHASASCDNVDRKVQELSAHPVPIIRLKMRKIALVKPTSRNVAISDRLE